MKESVNDILPPKSSIRNHILMSFFLVLAIAGVTINMIFLNVIHKTLTDEGLDHFIIENISRHFTIIGSGVTIAGIIIVLVIAFFLSESITKPIKKLTSGMIDIAKGKFDTRIEISSDNELGQLAEGFNFMARHIEDSLKKLKAAKEYTDNIVISVPSILIILSNRLNVLSTNMAFERLSEQYPTLVPNQFVDMLREEIHKNLTSGETIKKEIVLIPEGSETTLIFSAIISRIGSNGLDDDDKERASVLLTITDITERKKMKELVLQSKQDWEDTFNMIPDMITIHDKDYNIIHANKAAKKMLHLPVLEFFNICKCYKYYHGTNSAPPGCPSCDCLKTGMPATFEIFEPHLNKFIEIRSIPRINNKNEVIGLIHIARDISFRKKIEEEHNKLLIAITKAKIEWEMTFDSVLEFIVLIDKDLNITRCNRSFSAFVGKSIDDIVGHKCHEFFLCPSEQVKDCVDRMSKSRELLTKKTINTDSGRWLHVSHRPIKDEKGNFLKSVIIATDITDLKNAQQRLKESEKELKKKVEDLEKFYDMAVGRELKMKELKKEIKRLYKELEEYRNEPVKK
jgi:PAS domain S-box-containing protein